MDKIPLWQDHIQTALSPCENDGRASLCVVLAIAGDQMSRFEANRAFTSMNFEHIPFASHPYGFEIMVGVRVAVGLLPLAGLKRRGWLQAQQNGGASAC